MSHDTKRTNLFAGLWQALLETSRAAVAIHYGAPWANPAADRDEGRQAFRVYSAR